MRIEVALYKSSRWIRTFFMRLYSRIVSYVVLKGNGVTFRTYRTNGVPYVIGCLRGKTKDRQELCHEQWHKRQFYRVLRPLHFIGR